MFAKFSSSKRKKKKQLPVILGKQYLNQLAISYSLTYCQIVLQNKHVFQNKREVNFKLGRKTKTFEENVLRPELKYTN